MDYYIEPLKADCEELLSQFQRSESVRYEAFSAIWRKMDFSSIFHGNMSPNEMKTFSELILSIAYHYFLPPYTFQIRVGGLYLLYGLYHTQLASPKEKIRIALKDWDDIMKFQKDAVNAQHFDVVYIIRKLFSLKAFFFAAMPKLLTFQVKRKSRRDEVCEEFRERPERVKELMDMDVLEEIMNVQQHYEKMKAAITTTPGQADSAISLIRKDLALQLHDVIAEYHKRQENVVKLKPDPDDRDMGAGEGTSEQQECSKRASLLASIKSRCYGQLVEVSKSRRHRQVEIDTSGSGTDHGLVVTRRKKIPSLRARTRKNLIGDLKEETQEHARLSRPSRLMLPKDKEILDARPKPRKRFKW